MRTKAEIDAYNRRYYEENKDTILEKKKAQSPEYFREAQKRFRRKLRWEVLDAYGSVCACCGEENYEFLGIDHINGGGTKQRREMGSGFQLYPWLKKNGFPEGYRVLCHNCNMSIGHYGYCPHQKVD